MKVVNRNDGWICYRLNILGIRVWQAGSCQLIALYQGHWDTLGPRWDLPVNVPVTPEELKLAGADTLRVTGYQYMAEHPESDLVDLLAKRKDFETALMDGEAERASA